MRVEGGGRRGGGGGRALFYLSPFLNSKLQGVRQIYQIEKQATALFLRKSSLMQAYTMRIFL